MESNQLVKSIEDHVRDHVKIAIELVEIEQALDWRNIGHILAKTAINIDKSTKQNNIITVKSDKIMHESQLNLRHDNPKMEGNIVALCFK